MVSALDSAFTSRVYADEETAALFRDEAENASLNKIERELALEQE